MLISEKHKQRNTLKEPREGAIIEKCEQLIPLWTENRKCVLKTTHFTETTQHHKPKGIGDSMEG